MIEVVVVGIKLKCRAFDKGFLRSKTNLNEKQLSLKHLLFVLAAAAAPSVAGRLANATRKINTSNSRDRSW